ncbi:MAG: CHRD domain-containing protein [Gammaproteobacteria bacterium]
MRRRFVIALVTCLVTISTTGLAQRPEVFNARLDWVPIGGTERNDVAGEGALSAKLSGTNLTITGSFTGLPAKVTGAKLHAGVATGARGRGLVVADLQVAGGASGTVAGDVRLSAEQVAELKAGHLYVQIYSEKGVLPDHSTLWGWLLP